MIRVFYAAAKGADPAAVMDACARVRVFLTSVLEDEVKVVAAHEEWAANFATMGSWEGWVRDVAAGRVYPTYEPRYHLFVVPTVYVGKATAQILEVAMQERKKVLIWPTTAAEPQIATGIEEDDPQNYTHGWRVIGAPSGDY